MEQSTEATSRASEKLRPLCDELHAYLQRGGVLFSDDDNNVAASHDDGAAHLASRVALAMQGSRYLAVPTFKAFRKVDDLADIGKPTMWHHDTNRGHIVHGADGHPIVDDVPHPHPPRLEHAMRELLGDVLRDDDAAIALLARALS